jgi:enamine deaminase RidA (YjgF/YER057c/UK114 family)
MTIHREIRLLETPRFYTVWVDSGRYMEGCSRQNRSPRFFIFSGDSLAGKRMKRTRISSGSIFEGQIGYSRAVVAGDWIFVSGTTGFDYNTMSISEDLLKQTEQCFKNIELALQQANSSLQDVVRVIYVLPNGSEFEQCWPILRKYFDSVRPAAMMICAGLADPRMKIEIEVTAFRHSEA